MKLLVCDATEPDDVTSACARLGLPVIDLCLNPNWLPPDPEETLWVACGAPAVKMVQAAGWIPKKGGVEANRGKLFQGIQPQGWSKSVNLGVTYAPQIMHFDYAKFVVCQTDIAAFRRFETTGSMEPILGRYEYVDDLSGVIAFLKRKHAHTGQPVELALDTETEGLNPFDVNKRIVCLQASAMEGISDVVYVLGDHINPGPEITGPLYGGWQVSERLQRIIEQLQWIASQPWIKVVGANFKYDMLWLRVKWGIVFKNFAFDTCNGGSLLEENRPNTLNLHTKIYSPELGGYDDSFNATHNKAKMGEVPKEDLLPYAGGDTDACLRNYRKIRKGILQDNLTHDGKPAKNSLASVYMNLVHPTLYALHRMEHTGALVDKEKFHEMGSDLEGRMTEATRKAKQILPKSLIEKYGGETEHGGAPLSKPFMIAEYLFGKEYLGLEPKQETATGKPSTAEYHLAQFKEEPEAADLIEFYLDYKSVSKMYGTYYEGFLKHLRSDDRWHASYIIHKQGKDKNNEQDAGGTVTGRGSAVDPAFQCVTGDTEIITPEGVKLAGEIIDPLFGDDHTNPFRKHEMLVMGDGKWRVTSNVFRSWRSDIMTVVLVNGNEISCTPEHPIMTVDGWVAAKDLHSGHQLPIQYGFKRLNCNAPWANPKVCQALGIIAAQGYLDVKLPRVQIEVPEAFAHFIEMAFDSLGIPCTTDLLVEEQLAVVTAVVSEDWGQSGLMFLLAMSTPDDRRIPRELRFTDRFYDFMRGVIRVSGKQSVGGRNSQTLRLMKLNRELCLDIIREMMLENGRPGSIREFKEHCNVEMQGGTVYRLIKNCGLPLDDLKPIEEVGKICASLFVKEVYPSGAGFVYDFTVPDHKHFMANSMLVHNTAPKHSYWGKRLRECIIAPPGYKIIARDYSQGELKVAACWAGEQKMIEAYQSGIDLHTLTGGTVKGMSYEEALNLKTLDPKLYDALRQGGKAGNFGLLYGMTAFGFMMYADSVYGVKLTIDEAEEMRNAFFDLYPGLPPWHQAQIMEAMQTGQVRSPLGRVRRLHNIHSTVKEEKKKAQNQAINSPIQGTLVDMMWWSMGIIERERPELLNAFGQIHDQGLWYAPEDRVDEALAYSGEIMENLPFQKVFGWNPELAFTTDAEVGYDLANLQKV